MRLLLSRAARALTRARVPQTAVEMDQTRTICLQSCPVPPFATPSGDYSDGGFDDVTLSTLCCLEYGEWSHWHVPSI